MLKEHDHERRKTHRLLPPTNDEMKAAFHRAWGRAKDEGYVKREWMNLQSMLNRRCVRV